MGSVVEAVAGRSPATVVRASLDGDGRGGRWDQLSRLAPAARPRRSYARRGAGFSLELYAQGRLNSRLRSAPESRLLQFAESLSVSVGFRNLHLVLFTGAEL